MDDYTTAALVIWVFVGILIVVGVVLLAGRMRQSPPHQVKDLAARAMQHDTAKQDTGRRRTRPTTGRLESTQNDDDDSTPPPKTFVGRTFGRYRLSQFVGAGKTWAVFMAYRDDDFAPRYVVRLLTSRGVPDTFRRALHDRLVGLSRLQHASIIRPLDWNDKGRTAYVVQRYCPGLTMHQVMSQGRLPWKRAVVIVASLLEALKDHHGMGVPYLQLAPDGIVVTDQDAVQMVHLGVHRELYEPATGRRERNRADVDRLNQYLAGQAGWYLLTGQRLFAGRDAFFDGLLPTDPPLVSTEVPQVPLPIAQCLARLLRRDPEQRFASLSEALQEWTEAVSLAGR